GDELGLRADELLGERRKREAELLLETNRAQEAQRIVLEDRLRDGAQKAELKILAPAARVDVVAAGDRDGDRVDREVATREARLDRPVHRREVDRPPAAEHDAPRRVALRKSEWEPARPLCVRARRRLRIAAHDVDVEDAAAEQLIANGAADEPRVFGG